MPLVTSVIDDKSPLILYDATWLPGTGQDPFAPDYYRGTFTTNNVTGGAVTFNFNGSAIWIYGANRPNHGSYSVKLDSNTFPNFNGQGNNLFQQSLFAQSFSQGSHTLTLTNTASNSLYIDVDILVWQSEVGSTDDQLVLELVQDTDARFQYQEPAWSTTSSTSNINFNLFSNNTGHITQTYNASVTFTFTVGDVVSIYGPSGPSNGPYSAQMDGGEAVHYNATTAYPTNYGMMIFHADNLGPGSHQVVLTNLPDSGGQSLAIDHAELWTIDNNDTATPASSVSLSQNNKLSPGAIAGIAVAAAVALLCAGAAFFFYRRWRSALASQNHLYRIYTSQQRPPDPMTVPPSGFSSSLETRSSGNLFRNDATIQPFPAPVRQPTNILSVQNNATTHMASGPHDSRSLIDTVSLPTQSAADEGLGRRPLPEAPGGGLPLSAELPKLAGLRPGRNAAPADSSSIAPSSDIPPNYIQATGTATER